MKDKNGNTELAIAIITGKSDDEILQLMKESLNNVQEKNISSYYPLHLACICNCSEKVVLQLLTCFPQAASIQDEFSQYPLHCACACDRNHSEKVILQLLYYFPQAASHKNKFGDYPLHLACRNHCSAKVVLQLLNYFPQAASEQSKVGDYALHMACKNKQSEIVILALIDSNLLAVKAIDFVFEQTALDYDRDRHHSETIVKVLETLMKMSDYDLKHQIDILVEVYTNGVYNRQRQDSYQWLLLNPLTKQTNKQQRQQQRQQCLKNW
jgi:ankyrin repeat protein